MICLGISTANSSISVAVVTAGGRVLAETAVHETRDQGNRLISMVEAALNSAGITYADIDLVAAVTGPGSFTGIRIGLAAARGLALAMDKPVTGVSSIDIFKPVPATRDAVVVTAIESFREELYLALDDRPPVNLTPEDFIAAFMSDDRSVSVTLSGDAADKMAGALKNAGFGAVVLADSTFNTATKAAEIAWARYAEAGGNISLLPTADPFYLREADVSTSTKIRQIQIIDA